MTNAIPRIFISWSGEASKEIAIELKRLISFASDQVDTFMSDVDIQSGTRPLQILESELANCTTAVIIVTRETLERPWLNFEAGAISKQVGDLEHRIIPILCGMRLGEIPQHSPLAQFQGIELNRDGLKKFFEQLSLHAALNSEVTLRRAELLFDEFLAKSASATSTRHPGTKPPAKTQQVMLEEILVMQRRIWMELQEKPTDAGPDALNPSNRTARRNPIREALRAYGLESLPLTSRRERPGLYVVYAQEVDRRQAVLVVEALSHGQIDAAVGLGDGDWIATGPAANDYIQIMKHQKDLSVMKEKRSRNLGRT